MMLQKDDCIQEVILQRLLLNSVALQLSVCKKICLPLSLQQLSVSKGNFSSP